MRTRNRSLKARAGWLLPVTLTGALFGCPNQELAPLEPCTVSGVSLEVPQTGVDKVDLLFMIDNSGSMAEEQRKLAAVLPDMVRVLTTGQKDPANPKPKPDFPPVKSLHIGVISSDMGVNGAPAEDSCGEKSYLPTEMDPNSSTPARRNRPRGDDGIMNTSVEVAVAGIYGRPFGMATAPVQLMVPPDPECSRFALPPGQRFIDFNAERSNANDVAKHFSCIAKLGKNGCGLEQQLESLLKALTPNTSMLTFTGYQLPMPSKGNAGLPNSGAPNAGFLRDDAILAAVMVTDEEDCSIPDASNELFNRNSAMYQGEDLNVRCGLHPDRQHQVSRYVSGLKALKAKGYEDRLIFAGIVGVPRKAGASKVYSGRAELENLNKAPEMQFQITGARRDQVVPACTSTDGQAFPARRFVDTAKEFGDNGVITSICEDEYKSALDIIIDRIAAQLTGACLPRQLKRRADNKVDCDVVEIKNTPGADCNAMHYEARLPDRGGKTVCRVKQVAVPPPFAKPNQNPGGWYYDDFSEDVKNSCKTQQQRIAFTDDANPLAGSQVKFECFQPVVAANPESNGREAIGLACGSAVGEVDTDRCATKTSGGDVLQCIGGSCQMLCENAAQCPDGWVCQPPVDANTPAFCVNPTCPPGAT